MLVNVKFHNGLINGLRDNWEWVHLVFDHREWLVTSYAFPLVAANWIRRFQTCEFPAGRFAHFRVYGDLKIFHVVIQLFANHLRCLVPGALGQSNAQLLTLLLPFAVARDVIGNGTFNDWFRYLPGKYRAFAPSLLHCFLSLEISFPRVLSKQLKMYPRFKRGGLEQHMAVQTQEFKETILIIFWTINHGLVGKKNRLRPITT